MLGFSSLPPPFSLENPCSEQELDNSHYTMVAVMLLKQYIAAKPLLKFSRLHSTDTAELM